MDIPRNGIERVEETQPAKSDGYYHSPEDLIFIFAYPVATVFSTLWAIF